MITFEMFLLGLVFTGVTLGVAILELHNKDGGGFDG